MDAQNIHYSLIMRASIGSISSSSVVVVISTPHQLDESSECKSGNKAHQRHHTRDHVDH